MSQQTNPAPGRNTATVADLPTDHMRSAVVGQGILVRGEVSGEEDLMVYGRIEGTVTLPAQKVTIGVGGRVIANVHGRIVEIQGLVEGDVRGDEQVIIRAAGEVVGNIAAPRVLIEDGSRFRGAIDMDVKPKSERKGVTRPVMMSAES
jgi:cytoskeletal protein CcmA (bactofilin family)